MTHKEIERCQEQGESTKELQEGQEEQEEEEAC